MRQRVFCFHRDGAHRFEVFAHIFADCAVASRGAERKFAVFIHERNGKPVYLRLDGKNGGFAELFVRFRHEIAHLVI